MRTENLDIIYWSYM